jgi:hypothetical protein
MYNNKAYTSFHNNLDAQVRSYQTYQNGEWGVVEVPVFTTVDRGLSYQFFAHFHPYVKALAKELINNGVSALLGMDTQYVANPDLSLQTIPNSTRAVLLLPGGTTLSDSNGKPVLSGAPLNLPDSTAVTLPASTGLVDLNGNSLTLTGTFHFNLPGFIPASSTNGTQISLPSGTVLSTGTLTSALSVVIPDGTTALLASGASATLSDGTPVSIPNNTQVLLRSGLPLPVLYEQIFVPNVTNPDTYDPSNYVYTPYPVKNLDFSISGAYSLYNWELFFHAPLLIAIHLSQNQQYQDAQNWFHTIFDPTDDSTGPTPARFWKLAPFQYADVESIGEILVNLSTGEDPQLQQDTLNSISAWAQAPFQPFVVAQYRITAYMLKTVMAYLDNLIAWGDSLFSQYTKETINEATQIYVLAANILGPKPQVVPVQESTSSQTYSTLKGSLNAFGDALVDMEVDIPFDIAPASTTTADSGGSNLLNSIGQNSYGPDGSAQALFFCIPQNTTLLGYWDTVADRLFKIHNSLNIQGVFQQLPLFQPPLDPALLVQAAAEGMDVNAIVNGLNQPLPLVRFRLLVSKAAEICQEVKTLGANMLAAIEKEDNEAFTLLKAQHETILLNLGNSVKYAQWQEAIKNRQALEESLANATERYTYYQLLLGQSSSQISNSIQSMAPIDSTGLQNLSFSQAGEDGEPQMGFQAITVDIDQNAPTVSDGQYNTITTYESSELSDMEGARDAQTTASGLEALGSGLALIPQFKVHAQPMGCGATVDFGGQHLHSMASGLAAIARLVGEEFSFEASKAGKMGAYDRRQMDWIFQSNMAEGEMNLVSKQLRAAQIRENMAQTEYNNYQTQMQQAQDIENFLNGQAIGVGSQGQYQKTTTIGFYLWMKGALQTLYSNSFQLAFAAAKKAEQAVQHELGNPSLSYIQSNYLSGMESLLAGEKLLYDVKRMEMDYYDLNAREYEMTKHASLLQINPQALMQLRATGTCMVSLPEELFDLDGPGHYFRRIKSVALTIPCVTGPYTGVNCTLSLQNSAIRTSPQVQGSGYSDSQNLSAYYGTIQAVVTSSGQMDSGLFETNLNDERYLPFEYSGVISQWQLTLPSDVPQFDFDTITDVILHIRYTAREGGAVLKSAAVQNLENLVKAGDTVGSQRLFSIRREFPTEWAKFKSVVIGGATPSAALALTLLPQHYPFWAQTFVQNLALNKNPKITVSSVEFFAEMPPHSTVTTVNLNDKADLSGNNDPLNSDPSLGGLLDGSLSKIAEPLAVSAPSSPFTVYMDNNSMTDLWMMVTWGHS